VGNVGRDPELRFSPNGQAKTEFSVATTRSWKKDGAWEEATTWFNIVVWGERAERVADNIKKGMQVFVQGRTENRSWDDEKANTKKYRSEVIADVVYQLGRRGDEQAEYAPDLPAGDFGAPVAAAPRPLETPKRDELDDLPF
jgi:single-strand DNA-binding protein